METVTPLPSCKLAKIPEAPNLLFFLSKPDIWRRSSRKEVEREKGKQRQVRVNNAEELAVKGHGFVVESQRCGTPSRKDSKEEVRFR